MKYKCLRYGAVAILTLSLGLQSLTPILVKADTQSDMVTAKNRLDNAISSAKNADIEVTRDNDQTINADNDDSANSQIANDYNSQASNIEAQVSDYQKKVANYKKVLADYKKKYGQMNAVAGTELVQRLHLSREPNAKVTFSGARGVQITINKDRSFSDPALHKLDSGYHNGNGYARVVGFRGNLSGNLGTATWTNLNNSYYTDPSTKQTIKIAKITVDFSNIRPINHIPWWWMNRWNNEAGMNHADAGLVVYSDISNGIWYQKSDSVHLNFNFYDSNGNVIKFKSGSAYVSFGSLNHWDYSVMTHQYGGNYPKSFYHVEHTQLESGGRGLNLLGSLVTNHANNDEYADKPNLDDNHDVSLFDLTGNNIKFHWYTSHDSSDANYSQLYNFGETGIPSFGSPTPPKAPQLRYHYDKKNVKYTITTNYIGVKNGKNTTIADSTRQIVHTGDSYSTTSKSITGWKLNGTPSNATGTNVSSNITVNYYYSPISLNVTVNHLDAQTGKPLASSMVKTYYYGDTYTTSPISIKGYHVSKYPSNQTGKIGASDVVVTYYYDRDSETVRANYKSRNSGQTLAPSTIYKGLYGDPYTTSAETITGWHLFETPSNASGNYTVNTPDVNYLYDRDTEVVTAKYVDAEGNKLAEDKTYVGLYGLPYSTDAANVPDHHLTKMPDNASGYYSTSPITVTYVYGANPSIKEGLSANAVNSGNYDSSLKTTHQSTQYNNKYHYVSKINVGDAMTLDALNVRTTLTSDINPIINGKTINDQKIKVYTVTNGGLTDVTNQGSLSYTVNGKNVQSNSNPNVAIDMDKSRVITWTATKPSSLVGQTIVMDIPVIIRPDSLKLSAYRNNSGINVVNSTTLTEKNDVSNGVMLRTNTTSNKSFESNTVTNSLPNIYTIKAYKSVFNTASTVNGDIYFKIYPNLVGKPFGTASNAVTLSAMGKSQPLNVPLSDKPSIIKATVNNSSAPDNKEFNIRWDSHQTSDENKDLIMTSSLINSESVTNGVTTTVYNPDSTLYSSTTKAAQYKPSNSSGTDASNVESVEAYYDQNVNNSQRASLNEMQPLYVKLMEYMHGNYKRSVSAKSGYGIKNDVALNYYGRHLNTNSERDFITNQLATTFATDQDMTTVKGKSSSRIQNNRSERLDYDATTLSANELRSQINNAHDKMAFVNTVLPNDMTETLVNNRMNSDYMWDQAGNSLIRNTYFNSLSDSERNYVASVDADTQSAPRSPLLYKMAYKFNKRLLNNGIEYYDPENAHVSANNLRNASSPAADAQNGGYLFYTNQWLPLGEYGTTYRSNSFGSNKFVFKLSRQLNIYGHRYLAKGDGPTGDTYDDLAIQPVISNDLNKSNATFSSNDWSDR